MKRTFKTAAAVIFIALNATSAFAALSEGISIETPNSGTESARVFDSILENINHPEMSGSTLNNFKHSSQPAAVLLEGSSIGQEAALHYAAGVRTDNQPSPQLSPSSAPDIFMYGNRPVGYASSAYQYSSTSDLATSVSVRSINTQESSLVDNGIPTVITGDTAVATPIPAAGLLLASGLFTLPFFRNRRNEAV